MREAPLSNLLRSDFLNPAVFLSPKPLSITATAIPLASSPRLHAYGAFTAGAELLSDPRSLRSGDTNRTSGSLDKAAARFAGSETYKSRTSGHSALTWPEWLCTRDL